MSYIGTQRGRRKALVTIRIVHDGAGNSTIYKDNVSSGTAVMNTTTWFEIFASTTVAVNNIEIFDDAGEVLELGTGGAGAEVPLLKISPGGNAFIPIRIEQGTRLTLKAVSAVPTANCQSVINFYD